MKRPKNEQFAMKTKIGSKCASGLSNLLLCINTTSTLEKQIAKHQRQSI